MKPFKIEDFHINQVVYIDNVEEIIVGLSRAAISFESSFGFIPIGKLRGRLTFEKEEEND